jgi:hypothetical protein
MNASPAPVASTTAVLRDVLERSVTGNRLDVLTPDGRRQAIIGLTTAQAQTGYGRGVWNALTPSGLP